MPSGFYDANNVPDYGVAEMGKKTEQVVAAIGGIFQDRYNQKQYQDFIEGPQKDYQAKLQSVNDLLLDESNPEGPSQAIKMMGTALSTYMDEAGRYKSNPLIADRARAAFQGNQLMLEQVFTSRFKQQEIDIKQQKLGVDAAKATGELQEQSARTGLIQEQTAQLKAGKLGVTASGKLGKGAGTGKTPVGPAFLTGGPGSINLNASSDSQIDQAYATASANLSSPGDAAQQKARSSEMAGIRRSLAQEDVAQRAGRGEQRDIFDAQSNRTVQEPWDPTNQNHINEAESLIDPEDVKNRYIFSKILEEQPLTMPGVNPNDISKKLGWMKDPNLANPNAPVTREISEPNVGKILLGYDGWSNLKDQKSGKMPLDLAEAAQRLPAQYTQLQGPLRKGIDAAVGTMVTSTIKPKSVDEVKTLMKNAMYAVAGEYIGGGHANDKVTQGVLKSRYAAKKFSDAIAEKYADIIAENLGLKKKAAPPSETWLNVTNKWLKENTPLGDAEGLLGGIGHEAKGLLNKARE